MKTNESNPDNTEQFSALTRGLAGVCHHCGICPFAERKPDSAFGRLMRWHRTWCPAWAAHTRVYGVIPLGR
jgi:hypothetical protein